MNGLAYIPDYLHACAVHGCLFLSRVTTLTSPRALPPSQESPQPYSRFPRAVSGRRTFHGGQVTDRRQIGAPVAGNAVSLLNSPGIQQDPQTGRLTFLDKLTSKFSKRLALHLFCLRFRLRDCDVVYLMSSSVY